MLDKTKCDAFSAVVETGKKLVKNYVYLSQRFLKEFRGEIRKCIISERKTM